MTASESREVAIRSFDRFLSHLGTIPDPRRAEGKLYELPHVLLFAILAIVTGADSYRGIHTFIKTHRRRLNKAFTIVWKRAPAHTAIRYILQGLKPADVENVFRGPRKIPVACSRRRLWGEQRRIGRGTNRNHSRANSGQLTSGDNFSRSPFVNTPQT
jgi:hypothetical protein